MLRPSLTSRLSYSFQLFVNISYSDAPYMEFSLFSLSEKDVFPSSSIVPGAGKSLARPTSRCILFDGENISFDASPVIYINSTNISLIMLIEVIYRDRNLVSL